MLSCLNDYCSQLFCKLFVCKVYASIVLYLNTNEWFIFNGQIVCFRQESIGNLVVICWCYDLINPLPHKCTKSSPFPPKDVSTVRGAITHFHENILNFLIFNLSTIPRQCFYMKCKFIPTKAII